MKDAIKLIDKLYPVLLIGFLLWYNYDSVDHRDLKTAIEFALISALRHSFSPEK